jgi:hypothetical protein
LGLSVRRLGFACLLVCAAAPLSLARAQLAPVGVPRGVVRLELDGRMGIWDSQYLDGTRVPLGADLSSSALGQSLIPSLADADARIERITGITGYGLDLGKLTTDVIRDDNKGDLGLGLGLTNHITIFGRIPLVRARAQSTMALDVTTADAGLNPGDAVEASFFTQFTSAMSTLSANISNGTYSGATLALAQATLASGTALNSDLFGLISDPSTASFFVPTSSSTAGAAITAQVAALQTTLANDLGISGFTSAVLLPTETLTRDDFLAFLTDPTGLSTRIDNTTVTFRGDAETGLALTLLDHWDRDGHRGGTRLAVEGLVRYPTGSVPRANRLFSVGTGDGQTDIEGHVTLDLGGGNFGLRLEGDYNRQLAADFLARVAPPSQPFVGSGAITVVHNDPGDITTIAARPFVRLVRDLAIQGTALYWSRGADAVTYLTTADSLPGVNAGVLATGTDAKATVLGIGITYSNPGALRPGGRGLPVDAGWNYERVIKGTGGRVANTHSFTARFRVYFGLF